MTSIQIKFKSSYISPIDYYTSSSRIGIDLPPRRMWGWGSENNKMNGYCGETSVQTVGLYYGNYISQGIIIQVSGGKSLLLGNNSDTKACNALNFINTSKKVAYSIDDFRKFLQSTNMPIIMGWYDWIGDDSNVSTYDHIIVIKGFDNNSDTIYYNDHFLLDDSISPLTEIFKTRNECKTDDESVVPPYVFCAPNVVNKTCPSFGDCSNSGQCYCTYVLLITGNVDPLGELLPFQLFSDRPDEPDWGQQDGLNMSPVSLNFSALVSGLKVGKSYTLLRFDNYTKVPKNGFKNNIGTEDMKYVFTASSTSTTLSSIPILSQGVLSNGSYFYRCIQS